MDYVETTVVFKGVKKFGGRLEWRLVKSAPNHLLVPPNQVIKPRRGGAAKPRAQALGS